MPVHVENLTSRVSVGGSELGLTEEQLRKLVDLVASRLKADRRGGAAADTELRRSAGPTTGLDH